MTNLGSTSNEISGGNFFSTVIQGREITVVLPPELHPALSGLPEGSRVFAGRDEDLQQLLAFLAPADPKTSPLRVSAVGGLAGIGKTELALQAAHAALRNGWFPGGALFVDMFGYDPQRRVEAGTALEGLLRAAGIPSEHIPTELQDRSRLFSSVMAAYAAEGRPVLVVVDNVSSAAQARPLLPPAGSAIITSRHVLADLEARIVPLDTLTSQAGVDVLAGQLHLARGADGRVSDHPDDALSIAKLCAGLPLALRIVGALLAAHPVRPLSSMIADLLDARTRLDEMCYKGADGEVAVRSAFDLSFRQLELQQARALCLLTVNPGPEVSTEAASAATGLDLRSTRRHMEELARAHLIESSSYGRWRMHDLLRLYAQQLSEEHAAEHGREQATDRLLTWYLRMARAADLQIRALPGADVPDDHADRSAALTWLDAEREALTGAVRMAADTGRDSIAKSLPLQLATYFTLRHRFDDLLSTSEASVAAARRIGDRENEASARMNLGVAMQELRRFDEAIDALHQAATIYQQTGHPELVGGALNNLGLALGAQRRFREAIELLRNAAAIHHESGNRDEEGKALHSLGLVMNDAGQFSDAIEVLREAAAIHRETGNRHGQAHLATSRGAALLGQGRIDEATAAYQEAPAIYREVGDRHGEAVAANGLGLALQEAGQFEDAITRHLEAGEIYREIRDTHGEGLAQLNLGAALRKAGRLQEAIRIGQDAAVILRKSGDPYREAMAAGNLGQALNETGMFREAIEAYQDAATIYRQLNDPHEEGKALCNLGNVLQLASRLDEAIEAYSQAVTLLQEAGDRYREATASYNLGNAMKQTSRFHEAIEAYQDSIDIYHQANKPTDEGMALGNMGVALIEVGQRDEAISAWRAAAAIFSDAGNTEYHDMAQENLAMALGEQDR
jgi:tetratricopeptide (TPR) repeat protein